MKASALALSIAVFLMIFQTVFGTSDCPLLFHGIKGHSACVPTSPDYKFGSVSKEDIKVILEEHNKYRAEVNPPACNMLKLYWNDDLAYVAQRWANNCKFSHDRQFNRSIPGSLSTGQNLGYVGYVKYVGHTPWKFIILAWNKEKKDFTYDASTNNNRKVGHYVQVVWETTVVIGCGYALCKGFELFVCNYGPGVNYLQRNRPYEKCATETPLTDCKGKFCKNDGVMKKGSCECQCKTYSHIYGPECSTNCSVKDSGKCKDKRNCMFFNVPPECPWMCGTCPYLNQARDGNTEAPKTTGIKTTTEAEGSSRTDEHSGSEGRPGVFASKYSGMTVSPLLVLFISNWL